MKILRNFILFIFLCCSCKNENTNKVKNKPNTNHSNYIIDINKVQIPENFRDAIDKIEFIPLETKDESLLAQINKVVLYKDKFYVLDAQYSSLKAFDKQGRYIKSIGKLGRGPGEFTTLWDFNIDFQNEKLLLLSNNEKSVFEYDFEGNYIQTIKNNLFGSLFVRTDDAWYYYIDHNKNDLSQNYNLIVMDVSGKVIDRLFPFPKTLDMIFSDEGLLVKNREGVLCSTALSDTVFQLNTNHEIYPKYIFNFGKNALPKEARRSVDGFMEAEAEHTFLQRNFVESENLLAFSYREKRKIISAVCNKKGLLEDTTSVLTPIKLEYPIDIPVGLTDKDEIISFLEVEQLLNWIEKENIPDEDLKKMYPDLYNILPTLQPTDNPILVIYKMKVP